MALTITLPDEFVERIQRLANKANLDVEEVLGRVHLLLLSSLQEFSPLAISALSDDEVLQLADSHMTIEQNQQLSDLLHQQQMGELDADEQADLKIMMSLEMQGQQRKLEAWAEAVKRGLREPLGSV